MNEYAVVFNPPPSFLLPRRGAAPLSEISCLAWREREREREKGEWNCWLLPKTFFVGRLINHSAGGIYFHPPFYLQRSMQVNVFLCVYPGIGSIVKKRLMRTITVIIVGVNLDELDWRIGQSPFVHANQKSVT